jgi:DNA-binding transcriptional LysR family regulator
VALFERGAHGARLTSDGQLFLESARSFDAQHAAILRSAADLRAHHAGMLRIGLTNPASDSPVVQVLAEMVRQRPGMRLILTIGKSDTLNDAVEKGELDMAVTPSFPGSLFSCDRIELSEDWMRVAARAQHPLFGLSKLSLHDVDDYAWLLPSRQSNTRRLLTNILEQAGCSAPRVVVEADFRSDAAMGLLESTDLLTVVPASVLRNWPGRIEALPLPMLEIRRTLVLLTRAGATWSHLMVDFKDLLIARGPR